METLEGLIAVYGPAIVFFGTFLEGETIIVVAGFLSNQGIGDPVLVAIAAFLGSYIGDQFWFFLGRRHAANRLVVRITRLPYFRKVFSAIEDHPRKFILTFRFFYGLRIVSPVAIGLTSIAAWEFLVLNGISAAIWSIAFTALGYLSGQAIEAVLGNVEKVTHTLTVGAAIAIAIFIVFQIGLRIRRAMTRRRPPTDD